MKKVVFLGLGYIGLPTAAVAAAHGFEVIGVDVNPSVVETINQGKIHIVEPELGQVVRDVVQKGKLRAVCKPEAADAFFIVVPTPFKQNHRADITYVEAATRSVIPYLQEGNLFVIESTSPVYTTERMAEVIYKERPELKGKIHIAYCPERVLPGNTLYELVHNDRVIGGITFHGRTYRNIGYDWIQYIAQLDDGRALSIGLLNMDCVPGTMPDIILNNMTFQ